MLSTPFQNSEFFHRIEVTADLRNQDAQRLLGNHENALAEQKRLEERKANGVENADASEGLHPDGHEDNKQDNPRKKRKKNNSSDLESGTPRLRNLGAGHVDVTA